MLMVLHIAVYCLFLVAAVIYLLTSLGSGLRMEYRRPAIIGLLVSPVGLVVPYLLFMLVAVACNHSWPFDGIPVIDPIARVLVAALLLLGPCVGPPFVLFMAIRLAQRKGLS
jgi:hypothetical protein